MLVGVGGGDVGDIGEEEGLVGDFAGEVGGEGHGAYGCAVVALAAGDVVGSRRLIEFEEVLTCEFHGGVDCFAA